MKKEYVKPEMVVEQFMAELAFLEGSLVLGDGEGIPFSNERQSDRGTWGNLWDED